MARRKKQVDLEEAIEKDVAKTNGYDKEKTKNFVARIESLHADIASIMGSALNECKGVHADIKLVYDEAKEIAGIPKKALKRVIKARALERKAAEVREELEGEDQDSFDNIRLALGDFASTELGQAALNGATEQPQQEQPASVA